MTDRVPWVVVNAGIHSHAGQSKANAALVDFLLDQDRVVHLVGHDFDSKYDAHPGVRIHRVRRPLGVDMLGYLPIDWRGRAVAAEVLRENPAARVVVNGGLCVWGDINWVHCVHAAWPCVDDGAPSWFRLKNRAVKAWSRRSERIALERARLVIANSQQTKDWLVRLLKIPAERIEVVYLGADPSWEPPTDAERRAERERFGVRPAAPVVFFVGALSHDNNKGFDTLFEAWTRLCQGGSWDADLVVVGGGSGVASWRDRVSRLNLSSRVIFTGYSTRVIEMLAAADLLVSPARYEAYGLNVQEAVCRGVAALASGRSGITELFPSDLAGMILPNPDDAGDLAARLRVWRGGIDEWRNRFRALRDIVRRQTWRAMAEQIVERAERMLPRDALMPGNAKIASQSEG